MKLTKNFIQPIAGAMLCIFLFSCGGKNAQNGSGMVREYAVMTLQPDSMEWYSNYPAAIKGKRDIDRKSTRLNSSHTRPSRMPSSA